ncbi:MAG: imidazole glycerol phosphate synthase subunit HisF [Candidatus Epulonipiscioides saccharophilum]|nr:MAG: imidazole glycerol phosphate synthase subunit HisF [Epulopiscium sp. AS2M-Bin001]
MLTKRIIPCLDIRNGRVVKGMNFEGIKDVSDPVELAKYYNQEGADELVFYDITASLEGRKLFTSILEKVASEIFIPLTVGGGINTLQDFDRVLKSGADKVSVNSGAIKNKYLIKEAAEKYGSQCVVLSIDAKRIDNKFKVVTLGGRNVTDLDMVAWAKEASNLGAGEIVLNSIDMDGVKKGFDLEMLQALCQEVNVPVIASGGAGNMEDFKILFDSVPKVDAGLAASIFHYKQINIADLKKYLLQNNIIMRCI